MSKIIIWDKKTNLKDIKPEIWFEGYPRAKKDTLVLIYLENENFDEIVFIEDLEKNGFKGKTNEETVENYINGNKISEVDKLKQEIELLKASRDAEISALKSVVDEILLNGVGEIDV